MKLALIAFGIGVLVGMILSVICLSLCIARGRMSDMERRKESKDE